MNLNTFPGDIAQYFSVIHRAFLHDTQPKYRELSLNATSAYILVRLAKYGQSNQNNLAKYLVINKGQVTREIKRLVDLDLVSKQTMTENRTANVINITEKGQKLIPKIVAIRNEWWQARLKNEKIDENSGFFSAITRIGREVTGQPKE